MKSHILVSVSATIALLITSSCANPASKLEKAAHSQVLSMLTETANDPASIKLDNIQTEYLDDSLCILHLNHAGRDGLGRDFSDRIEYYLIGSKGKYYESFQIFNGTGAIYCTEDQYNKQRRGKIYENLPYAQGMRHRVAVFTNVFGREVGDIDGEPFLIPTLTGTGLWEVMAFQDEFGEEGQGKYLSLRGCGTFTDSVYSGREMSAYLFVDKDGGFSFRIIKYHYLTIKDNHLYDYRIKDSSGEIYNMRFENSYSDGEMGSKAKREVNMMDKILKKGGIITVSVKELNSYGHADTYLFKMNVTGFDKAMRYIQ